MFLSDYAFSSYRRSSASIVAASALLVMLGGCGDDGSANNNGTANNNSSPTNNGTQLQPSDCSEYETLATDITNELTLDGCYKAESGVRVSGDGALSIEDGTIIVFAENTGLLVDDGGTLTAKGSADPGILFAGEESDRGYWRGVKFQETDLSDNQLSWVTIDGGGSDNNYGDIAPANLALDDRFGPVKVAVDHTTLRNSGGVGIFADQNTALVDFADNTLTGNAKGAARLHPMVVGDLDAASDYSGNDVDVVEIYAGDVKESSTWKGINVPYAVADSVSISGEGSDITINGGATFQFAENKGLLIDGGATLTANGASEDPINFEGDESAPGYWRGVKFENTDSSLNQLSWVTIDGGGSDNNYGDIAPANLALDDRFGPVKVAVDHTTLRNSGNVGLFADQNTALVDFADNTLTGNATGAARLHPMVVGDLDAASDYSGNDVDVVEIYAGDVKESATWKGINVPYAVADSVSISGEGSDITINGGATFQFAENKGLLIDGGATLTANGTSEDPINFEGDESAPGYWRGVKFENTDSSLNQLIWVTIDGGGSDNNYNDIEPANLALDDRFGPVSIGLEHVTFGDEASAIFSDSNVTIAPCTGLSISASDIIGSGAAAAATACGL